MRMDIEQTLDKIYSYVDYSLTHAAQVPRDVFSLDRIRLLLSLMGNPQKSYPVIHVAGTKGKGSVCAMLAAALQNAGLHVGLYTSPHLIKFNERIMVDGAMICDENLIDLTEKICKIVDPVAPVSTFELTTAIAFEYFRQKTVDIAVVETGLGGRLDATNVVDPLLTVITSISMDHMEFLGSTIEEIASEKAGIIQHKVPVICAPMAAEAERVIWRTAAERGCAWINVSERFRFINAEDNADGQTILIWRSENQQLMNEYLRGDSSSGWRPQRFYIPLAGLHQMQNAATVFAVLTKIKSIYTKIDFAKMLDGLAHTFWPCRFERISQMPLVYLDGAHNRDSVEKLSILLDRCLGRKVIKCVFGASGDKPCQQMIDVLAPHVSEFIVTRSTHPRAADPKTLQKMVWKSGRPCRLTASLEEALTLMDAEKAVDVCYIVCGSLFTAAGIRELYMKRDHTIPYFLTSENE